MRLMAIVFSLASSIAVAGDNKEDGILRLIPDGKRPGVYRFVNGTKWPVAFLAVSDDAGKGGLKGDFCGAKMPVAVVGQVYTGLTVDNFPPDPNKENINYIGRWILVSAGHEALLRPDQPLPSLPQARFAIEVQFPWQLDCAGDRSELNREFRIRVGYRSQ